jgi:type I restriction enzyme S subunit
MSKLSEMIARLCPNGVEYKKLGEVARIRNGRDYKHLGKGEIPVYGSGGIMTYVDSFAYDGQSVLIPRKGSLDKIYYTEGKIWTVDTIFYTEIDQSVVLPKFLYYYLQAQHIERLNTAGGVPSLTQAVLSKISIPLPPLEIQREVVEILDNFANLTAELTAELAKRKKQYEHYRDMLLNFDGGGRYDKFGIESGEFRVEWKRLGEIAEIQRGRVMSKDYLREHTGEFPVYSSQTANEGVFGYIDTYDFDGEYLTWTTDGANAGSVFYHKGKFSITNVCGLVKTNCDVLNVKYLYYWLGANAKKYVSSGMGNPKLMSNVMASIKIPLPPLAEQERIVAILDRFDSLCNSLTEGLPAEIALRKKQYEYYRDKLLSFKEASC